MPSFLAGIVGADPVELRRAILSMFAAKLTNVLGGAEAIGCRLDRLRIVFSNGVSRREADGTPTALHAVALGLLVVLVVVVAVATIDGRITPLSNGVKSCVFHGSTSGHRARRQPPLHPS